MVCQQKGQGGSATLFYKAALTALSRTTSSVLRQAPPNVHALRVDNEACVDKEDKEEGVEHHMWSSDSRPACRGILALHSSKPVPRCTAVRA